MPRIPSPWGAFLEDIDDVLSEPGTLHCFGGFVVAVHYGFPGRVTGDIDVLPSSSVPDLGALAGEGSPLHKRHKVYLECVTVSTCPERYEERMTEIFPGALRRLRLYALGPYDLVLSKLDRHFEHDREDILFLAEKIPLDVVRLRGVYEDEMRPFLGDLPQQRADLTLDLWIQAIEEKRGKRT